MDDPTPPPRRLVLKQKDVEPTDKAARPGDGTAISVRLIHLGNRLAEERAAGQTPGESGQRAEGPSYAEALPPGFKHKEIAPLDPPVKPGDEEAIHVPDILRANRLAADELGPELIAMPVPRRSRRNRDFLVLVACALLCTGTLAFVFRADRQIVALALFGIVFLTVILAWILYGVMDRY
jgi:hypothetical protein